MVQRSLVLHVGLFFLVIGHFTLGQTEWERTYCLSVAFERIDTQSLRDPYSKHRFLAHKEVIQESSRNGAEYSGATPLFPNLHFNPEMMTRANSELVDVSQKGQTSPSVSIIAARQVSLLDPHGEPPFWIRGDTSLPL